jgi:PDZ domain-containing secreted protein
LDRKKRNEYEIAQIEEEIFHKTLSLEHFWRSAMHYLNRRETDHVEAIENYIDQKEDYFEGIRNLMQNGEAFELIDGENFEFKDILIREVAEKTSKDKVIVVAVIGP